MGDVAPAALRAGPGTPGLTGFSGARERGDRCQRPIGGTSAGTGRAREARARSVRRSSGCARHRCAALASKARPEANAPACLIACAVLGTAMHMGPDGATPQRVSPIGGACITAIRSSPRVPVRPARAPTRGSVQEISKACRVWMQGKLLHGAKVGCRFSPVNGPTPVATQLIAKAPLGAGAFAWQRVVHVRKMPSTPL